jgi:hypothetical protein
MGGRTSSRLDLFISADYFNLFDKYGKAYGTSDFITSISFDGHSKAVVDEVGYYDGMPDVVSNVERELTASRAHRFG